MSNSRKIKRNIKRNVSTVGAAAVGTAMVASGLLIGAGAAFAAPTVSVTNPTGATPNVYPGLSNQPAGSVTLTVNNQFNSGDTIAVPIETGATSATAVPANTALTSLTKAISYSALPTVTVSANTATETTNGDTAPKVTASLTTWYADGNVATNAGLTDELLLTFSNGATGIANDTYTITLSGVQYNVGSAITAPENAYLGASYNLKGTTPPATPTSPAQNAVIQNYQLTETPTGAPTNGTVKLSDFALKEMQPGTFAATSAGTVYTLAAGSGALSGTATVTATGFTVAAVGTSGCPASGTASASVAASSGKLTFCVYGPTTATTGPGSLTISGLSYTAGGTSGSDTITLTATGGGSWATTQPAVTVVTNPTVAGFSADDTAAKAADTFASQVGPGNVGAVLLASDAEYQDALSASYLIHSRLPAAATYYNGANYSTDNPLLLNPYDTANEGSTAAAAEIRKLGVGTVYIIGGTSAISQDVQNQLEKMQVGTSIIGTPIYLQVVRIAGYTAEDTAYQVATYPGTGSAGSLPATPAAYGMYNSGASESATPVGVAATSTNTGVAATPVTTAIVADANEFQDALSSSGLAASYRLPVLLTPGGQGLDTNVSKAIANLGIKQVIVVGGSAAVSDQAVSDLEATGVSVLRIAGTTFDATANELAQFETNKFTATTTVGNVTTNGSQEGLGSVEKASATTSLNSGPSLTVGTSRGDAYQDALASAQVLGAKVGNPAFNEAYVSPLLLNSGTSVMGTGTADFLTTHGTPPNASYLVYTSNTDAVGTSERVLGDIVFGGTLAQTPALVQAELNDIAAG